MGRKTNPISMYRVSIHRTNGYCYASTQPARYDEKTGKNIHLHVHWGVVDENLKFYPGKNYFYADIEERSKLIFPKNWDLSELNRLYGQNTVNIINVDASKTSKTSETKRKEQEIEENFEEYLENEIPIAEEHEEELEVEI